MTDFFDDYRPVVLQNVPQAKLIFHKHFEIVLKLSSLNKLMKCVYVYVFVS